MFQKRIIVFLASAFAALRGQTIAIPPMPADLQVPPGNTAYLKAQATGTQNYVCLPSASGLAWKFQGPQATLFVTYKWFGGEIRQQVTTHYLSPNPSEAGNPARATWQSSLDTSAIWAKKVAETVDPAYVAPGAIPWLKLQVVGAENGPSGSPNGPRRAAQKDESRRRFAVCCQTVQCGEDR
ncbi:MAG: DUF3455 domain-containing protein, partial [Acidobacteria bacterium]|nr:DUF3455 domain-containing protein [Acidobacteriota bacterium]